MNREIRRVPANWEHPRIICPHAPWKGGCDDAKANGGKCYKPLYDQDFDDALTEWLEEYALWKKNEHPLQNIYQDGTPYWEYAGAPPNPYDYRPKWEKAEWYQVYSTINEGTPLTPPFETVKELAEHLIKYGEFGDDSGWSREAAANFIARELDIS